MAPHFSTLAWKIPWTEEPGRLQSMGSLIVGHFSLSCIGEGNGNPFQCSCLENPRDKGAWWAAVYGVTQSQTRLKRLSSSSSNGSDGKEPACDARDGCLIPGWGRCPAEGNGCLLGCSPHLAPDKTKLSHHAIFFFLKST